MRSSATGLNSLPPDTFRALQSTQLPFAYARAHGVLLDTSCATCTILHRPGMNPAVLGELSRKFGPDLQLQQISFRYRESEADTLRDISLQLPRGAVLVFRRRASER